MTPEHPVHALRLQLDGIVNRDRELAEAVINDMAAERLREQIRDQGEEPCA